MLFGRRCPNCGRKGLRGYASKVVVEAMMEGLRANPEWLYSECRRCGARFKERHYGDGTLVSIDADEWRTNVASE